MRKKELCYIYYVGELKPPKEAFTSVTIGKSYHISSNKYLQFILKNRGI